MSQPLEVLPHFQNSNEIPTDSEQATVKQSLDVLQSRISQLESQLEELQKQALVQKTIISPVKRLPAEILGAIFLFILPNAVLDVKSRTTFQHLNLVCRGWRTACLLTHRLWSGIQMGPMDHEYEKILTWLERSGKLPKTLEFNSPHSKTPPWKKCECSDGQPCYSTNAVLRRLLTEGPILQHFKLRCCSSQCYLNWVAAVSSVPEAASQPRPWDHLGAFELVFYFDARWDEPADPSKSIFHHLPPTPTLLLELPLSFSAFEDPADSVNAVLHLPSQGFTTLTTLTIQWDWYGTHIIDLLEHCPQLECVTINSNSTSPDDEPIAVRLETLVDFPVTLPKLHTLHFECISKIDLLKYIRTPLLRHLYLQWPAGPDPLPDRSFAIVLSNFIHESNLEAKLESLHLSNLCTLTDHFAYFLSNLWGLQHLTLQRVTVPGVWVVWQLFHQRAKAVIRAPEEEIKPPFKGRHYLPALKKLELLDIPDDYRVEWIGIYLTARTEGIPCDVTISYERESRRKRQGEFLKMFVDKKEGGGISAVTILE